MGTTMTINHLCLMFTGAKITQTKDGTRIIESDGTSLTVGSEEALQHLAPQSQELCRSAHEVGEIVAFHLLADNSL